MEWLPRKDAMLGVGEFLFLSLGLEEKILKILEALTNRVSEGGQRAVNKNCQTN